MAKTEELYRKAEEFSEKAGELFKESDQLREEANDVWQDCEERQEAIDDLRAEARQLVQEFRDLYQQSQEAYGDGDGALAKQLSLEGREKQNECGEINEEVGERIRELRGLREKLSSLNQEAKQKREEAFACVEEVRRLREQAKSANKEWRISEVHPGEGKSAPLGEHIDVYHQDVKRGKRDRSHGEDPLKVGYDKRKPRTRDIWPPRKKK